MRQYFDRLKTKWGITSNFALAIIITVFALTGSSAVYVSNQFINFFLDPSLSSGWVRTVLKICITTPIYMVLLVTFGTVFGQFQFFWNFAKRMVKGFGKLFSFVFRLKQS